MRARHVFAVAGRVLTVKMALLQIAVIFVILLGATELMFRVGRRLRTRYDERTREQTVTVQTATLGLLALMLAFTMSMAESRFDARRRIKVAEAAAVGTTYLRAELLPEPQRSESRALLRSYVAERRAFYRAIEDDVRRSTAHARALQAQLWTLASGAATAHPEWDVLTTYLESLNAVFDLEAARSVAVEARLPAEIHLVLVLMAGAAVAITAFLAGVAGARNVFALYMIPLLIAITCAVIFDLDRARFGFIKASDIPMERVEQGMAADQQAAR
jgi:hypothetical protein